MNQLNIATLGDNSAATSLASNHADLKSLKRPFETTAAPDESLSVSLNKKQSIEFLDTNEFVRKVHSIVFGQRISYAMFACEHQISSPELIELLENQKPWHLLDEMKQKQFSRINTSIQDVKITDEFDMTKSAKNSDGSLDTGVLCMQIVYLLYKCSAGPIFFKKYLGLQNRIKKFFKEPTAWAQCNEEEKNEYSCCYEWWINAGEETVAKLVTEHRAYTTMRYKSVSKSKS
jgi:hypothetical protein